MYKIFINCLERIERDKEIIFHKDSQKRTFMEKCFVIPAVLANFKNKYSTTKALMTKF